MKSRPGMRSGCAALLVLAAAGCGGAGLAQLESPLLILEVTLASGEARDAKNPQTIQVRLPHDGACDDLEPATAKVNGADIPETQAGGMAGGLTRAYCASKLFKASAPRSLPAVDGTVSVRISDKEDAFEAAFSGLCERRTLAIRSPTAPIRAGDQVELEWLPDGDRISAEQILLESANGGWNKNIASELIEVSSNRIRFTMPEIPDEYVGPVSLEFRSDAPDDPHGSFHVPATRCEGPSRCLAYCSDTEPLPITIAVTVSGASATNGLFGGQPLAPASSLHYAIESDDAAYSGSVAVTLTEAARACDSLQANTAPGNSRALQLQLFNWDGAKNQPLALGEYWLGGELNHHPRMFAEVRYVEREGCAVTVVQKATGGHVTITGYDANGRLEGTFSILADGQHLSGRMVADRCAPPPVEQPPSCQ